MKEQKMCLFVYPCCGKKTWIKYHSYHNIKRKPNCRCTSCYLKTVRNSRKDKDGYILRHIASYTEEEQRILLPMARTLSGNKKNNTWLREHRAVIALKLGRALLPTEIIHHLDGIKDNNSLENLQLLEGDEHCRIHSGAGMTAQQVHQLQEIKKQLIVWLL